MGVMFAHDVAVAGGFVNGITHGVTRGNSEFAQQQNRRRGKVFAMAAAAVQKKTRQRRLVGARHLVRSQPGAVTEIGREKLLDGEKFPFSGRAGYFHFGNDLVQRRNFVGRHGQIQMVRAGIRRRIKSRAGAVVRVENHQPQARRPAPRRHCWFST